MFCAAGVFDFDVVGFLIMHFLEAMVLLCRRRVVVERVLSEYFMHFLGAMVLLCRRRVVVEKVLSEYCSPHQEVFVEEVSLRVLVQCVFQ